MSKVFEQSLEEPIRRHTKTPWFVSEDAQGNPTIVDNEYCIAKLNTSRLEPEANAQFIVKAVNNHQALVVALRLSLNALATLTAAIESKSSNAEDAKLARETWEHLSSVYQSVKET